MRTLVSERLGERLHHERLENGLNVFVLPRPGYSKKYASFATRYGSVDNTFLVPATGERARVPDGIAHFLEHQMFAQEYGDAFERFSEHGASANAFTSYTSTTYLFSCTDNWDENLAVLLDFVQSPHFTDRGTEKERGIIQQEIRMYEDNPGWRLRQGLHAALYREHPFRVDIAGTVESVGQITTPLLRLCYDTFYHPSNMVLSAVGDLDPAQVFAAARASAAAHPRPERDRPVQRLLPEEPEPVAERRFEARMPVARPMLAIGFKERQTGLAGGDLLRRDIASEVLMEVLFGRASRNYEAWYEAGLIDKTFSASYYGEETFGLSRVGGETDRPDELERSVLEAVRRARAEGVSEEDFARVRAKLTGQFLAAFNSPEELSYLVNATFFLGTTLFGYMQAFERVTRADVEARLRDHLDPDFSAVALIRPS
jgi:predicted Zn-dependent peptidase